MLHNISTILYALIIVSGSTCSCFSWFDLDFGIILEADIYIDDRPRTVILFLFYRISWLANLLYATVYMVFDTRKYINGDICLQAVT